MELFENNPTTFLNKYIQAVKDGWRLQYSNEGWVQDSINGGCFQVVLEKDEEYTASTIQVGQHVISSYDRQEFFRSVQDHVLNGAEFNLDSLLYDVAGLKSVRCVIRPTETYTREQLEAMPWEDFKELAKKYDTFNRNREVCTNMLVKVFEEV